MSHRKTEIWGIALIVGLLFLTAVAALAAEPLKTDKAEVVFAGQGFWLDGWEDDWKDIPRYTGFYIAETEPKKEFEYKTEFAVARDDNYLYVLVVCRDQSDMEISATRQDGDFDWNNDDIVELLIKPGKDAAPVHYVVNPAGTKFGNFIEVGTFNYSYEVKAATQFDHWVVEFQIPLGDVNLPMPQEGDTWQFKVIRRYSLRMTQGIWPQGGKFYADDNYGTITFAAKK